MKIIYNKILPFGKRYYAINLFGVLFAKGPCGPRMLNHEKIHTAQIKELLYLFFYLWYLVEWLIKTVKYRDSHKAYLNISFEREAYTNDADMQYLPYRKSFAFLRYF